MVPEWTWTPEVTDQRSTCLSIYSVSAWRGTDDLVWDLSDETLRTSWYPLHSLWRLGRAGRLGEDLGAVHTKTLFCENAHVLHRFGQPSTPTHHSALFWKWVSGWRNPKTQPSRFHVDGKSAYFPKQMHEIQPNFYVFHKELCHYFSSLKCMEKKNALKRCRLVEKLNLTENP